ncbi:hypothetical protein MUA04_17875 [Enterobacteriaceae bacterium H11S18]|uniref:putative T6SS immunity periplasmic lipoprotein n=1 Tax=Dryocola clanedunensis TaxID=2925396 RepID=UPI0022F0AE35|nr:putative T6SS immunity periplasmic lipoprotein [Dryocola clanedunensis]MCT4712044.1 hypothetical protein [Dryocola clanedunensis]
MKKLMILFPIVVLLAGCPGRDGLKMGEIRSIYINGDRICFTVNKQDVLTRYLLATNGQDYKVLLSADTVRLSYPDSCFTVNLQQGVIYGANYALNEKNYSYTFIIDKENNIVHPGR